MLCVGEWACGVLCGVGCCLLCVDGWACGLCLCAVCAVCGMMNGGACSRLSLLCVGIILRAREYFHHYSLLQSSLSRSLRVVDFSPGFVLFPFASCLQTAAALRSQLADAQRTTQAAVTQADEVRVLWRAADSNAQQATRAARESADALQQARAATTTAERVSATLQTQLEAAMRDAATAKETIRLLDGERDALQSLLDEHAERLATLGEERGKDARAVADLGAALQHAQRQVRRVLLLVGRAL